MLSAFLATIATTYLGTFSNLFAWIARSNWHIGVLGIGFSYGPAEPPAAASPLSNIASARTGLEAALSSLDTIERTYRDREQDLERIATDIEEKQRVAIEAAKLSEAAQEAMALDSGALRTALTPPPRSRLERAADISGGLLLGIVGSVIGATVLSLVT